MASVWHRRLRFIIKLIPHSQHVWKSECLPNSSEGSVFFCKISVYSTILHNVAVAALRNGLPRNEPFFDLIMLEAYTLRLKTTA